MIRAAASLQTTGVIARAGLRDLRQSLRPDNRSRSACSASEPEIPSDADLAIEDALARHDASAAARLEERYFPERAAARGEYSRQMRPGRAVRDVSQSKGDEPAVKRGGILETVDRLLKGGR